MITIRHRRTVVIAVVVAAIATVTVLAGGGSAGSISADAPTGSTVPTTTTTTTIPEVGVLADEVDLARLIDLSETTTAPVPDTTEPAEPAETTEEAKPSGGGGDAPAPSTPAGPSGVDAIAAAYGLRVRYGRTPCGQPVRPGHVGGCIVSTHRSTIYLTARTPVGRAERVVRHEISHHEVLRRCQTTRPAAAGGRSENVTDAYTELFIGPGSNDYGYGPADEAIARRIYGGDCGGVSPQAPASAPAPVRPTPAPAPAPAPTTTTTTTPLPPPGHVAAQIRGRAGATVDVRSPQPVGTVGACVSATAPAGWGASCAGSRVTIENAAGAGAGSTATIRVETARGWGYTVLVTAT